jgi:hypothetical protein
MNHSILKTILLFCVLGFFTGCSLDRVQIISHPTAVKPGDTISVLFSDIYIIIAATPTLTQTYSRDSLHIGYGLPSGWSLLSSEYYVATGIQLGQMSSLISDPTLIMQLIQDSLALYMARKLPMTKDNGWSGFFTGKTFSAHNTANTDSIRLIANTVGKWTAYSSRISISAANGAKMDTGVALTSLPVDSSTRKMISSFYHTDTIWVKTIPIVCFARLIAGQTEKDDTLYYYTKTDVMPTPAALQSQYNFDRGDMTYAVININKANAVEQIPSHSRAQSLLTVRQGTGATTRIGIGAKTRGELSICDIMGKTVWRFGLAQNQNSDVVWDHTTSAGARVNPGVYVVRLQAQEQSAAQTVRIVK